MKKQPGGAGLLVQQGAWGVDQPRSARAPRTLPLEPDVSEPVPVVVLLFMLDVSLPAVVPEPVVVPEPLAAEGSVVLPAPMVVELEPALAPVVAPMLLPVPVLLPAPMVAVLPLLPVPDAVEPALPAPEPWAMATPPRARAAAAVRIERVCFAVFMCFP